MKKRIYLICFLVIVATLFLFSKNVEANSIEKIDMDVYINSNGDAVITEVWKAYLNQGTEGFRPYSNLEKSSITNFSVKDEKENIYKLRSGWYSSISFEDKAYKCGIKNVSNGVELCWGISEYGNKTYTLNYTINNFIREYTDTQGIYFNFLNLDQEVGEANITIHSDYSFSLNNAKIWAFGNKGTINFNNGNIEYLGGRLTKKQYMVALIKFEGNLFKTNNKISYSFDRDFKSATNGINTKEKEEVSKKEGIFNFKFLFMILMVVPVFAIYYIVFKYGFKWFLDNCTSTRNKI